MKLTDAEFMAMRGRIAMMAKVAETIDAEALAEFIRKCDTADTIGPFLDPTLWMEGHESLKVMTAHARAVATFRREVMRAVGVTT